MFIDAQFSWYMRITTFDLLIDKEDDDVVGYDELPTFKH